MDERAAIIALLSIDKVENHIAMLTSCWNFITRRGSDPPPSYHAIDPLSQPSPISSEQDTSASERRNETPRKRFDYHVALHEYQRVQQWRRTYMDSNLYNDLEAPNIPVRNWVIQEWQKYGIWASTWPATGPGDQEKWECGSPEGVPAGLLSMELGWEIDNIMLIEQPVFIPCLAATQTRLPVNIPPNEWKPWRPCEVIEEASSRLLKRWKQNGFSSSTIEQPTLGFRRDLGELLAWLPPRARNKLSSQNVTRWSQLLCGWVENVEGYASDLLGLGLSARLPDNDIATVRKAVAESLRLDTLRQMSPLQAPVTRAARADGTESPRSEEMNEVSGPQSPSVEISGILGHPSDSRAMSSAVGQESVPERVTRRSPRKARRDATGPSRARSVRHEEATRRRAVSRPEIDCATETPENIASRRRPRRRSRPLRDDDHGHGAKRRRLA